MKSIFATKIIEKNEILIFESVKCHAFWKYMYTDTYRPLLIVDPTYLHLKILRKKLKYIGSSELLYAVWLVNVFIIPLSQFTGLPADHRQFYGQLMVCLSSFRGIVGNLSGYITTCKTLADLHCKAA